MLLNFALALLPIAWLIAALAGLKIASHLACLAALGIAAALAAARWQLSLINIGTAALEGVLNALWPICLVVIAALYAYGVIVRTGAMDAIKHMLCGVSRDIRVLALLIGWGFGNFMEGMAGFGTAVAIPASMLAGIGMNPLAAVVGCLVVNSTPTAFGSVGVPTVTLASVTGLDAVPLSGSISVIQCLLTFASPFFLVCICGGGWRALKGMLPLTFAAAGSFVIPWFAAAQILGPELPDILGAVCSMACIIGLTRLNKSASDPAFSLVNEENEGVSPSVGKAAERLSLREGLRAWSPFVLILVLLLGTSSLCPPVHDALASFKTSVSVYTGADPNTLAFSWINTPGVMIFAAAIAGGLIQGATLRMLADVFAETLKKYWKTVLTICSVMAMAKVMGYSGMIADIATVLVAAAGPLYPLIAPAIGALGAFVTGSGTSTNVLFGQLQTQTATALGMSPSWMAAANVMGAGIGKMICPQGIAIGASATGLLGSERAIMGAVLRYFVLYLVFAGIICMTGSALGL